MEGSTDLFINLIQNHRILYDKSLKDFKNIRKKEEAWKSVATTSRMTVDSAKKRYFSLRQKYCREKKNIEVRQRFKLQPKKLWVYHERLHFLDSFIQPRTTYTNDTLFDEDNDEQMNGSEVADHNEQMYENGVASENFAGVNESNIEIQVEEGVDVDELNVIYGGSESMEVERHSNRQFIDLSQNHQDIRQDVHQNVRQDAHQTVRHDAHQTVRQDAHQTVHQDAHQTVRQDAHQTVRHDAHQSVCKDTQQTVRQDAQQTARQDVRDVNEFFESANVDGESIRTEHLVSEYTGEESTFNYIPGHIDSGERYPQPAAKTTVTNEDSYVSPHPHTSASSQRYPSLVQNSLTVGNKTASTMKRIEQETAPKNVNRRDQSNRAISSVREPRNVTHSSATSTEPSNEKRIEMIRQRMDSCLAAITNKVTEKATRSPHAPFLAYLGTKLPNVPADILPDLERKILDFVDSHSK